jgi:hypothetical protein
MRNVASAAVLLGMGFWLAPAGCAGPMVDPTPPAAATAMTPDAFAAHVDFLAAPARGGRVAGTAGNRAAAEYVAEQFRQAGLRPAGAGGTFFQPFPCDRLLVPEEGCTLAYQPPPGGSTQPAAATAIAAGAAAGSVTAPAAAPAAPAIMGQLGRDFAPSAQGRLGAFSAPLVFAGYGLHNHLRNYDDYAHLAAGGAVVMILAGEPHEASGQSRWALAGAQTHLAELPYKLRLARQQGAVAALVVTPPALSPQDDIDDVLGDCTGALPAVRITRGLADRLLAAGGERRTIEQLVGLIHQTHRPQSFALGGTITGKVALAEGPCRNVLGVLPPDAADDGRVVLIGAHYDHIPATGQLATDAGPGVRGGADDNASGVAALLLLARGLAATPGRHCTYLLAAFDAEEVGFAGSRHYVRHPALPLDRLAAMVNIDQIGYLGPSGLMVLGSTLDPALGKAIAQASRPSPLRVQPVPVTSARRWSDQAAFVRAGVPTLFFYGRRTPAYHSRRDTPDRINVPGGAATARLIYGVLQAMEGSSGRQPVPPD